MGRKGARGSGGVRPRGSGKGSDWGVVGVVGESWGEV